MLFETTLNPQPTPAKPVSAGVPPGIKPASQLPTTQQQIRRAGQCVLSASNTQPYDNATRCGWYRDPPFTEEEPEAQSQVSNLPEITELKLWKPGHQWGLTLTRALASPWACPSHTALPGHHPHGPLLRCYVCALSPSLVPDSTTPWTATREAPLSMGILQARILEWVAMPSSRGSSPPIDRTQVSCTAGGFFPIWATREAPAEKTVITDMESSLTPVSVTTSHVVCLPG